jgi:hypothetical protein
MGELGREEFATADKGETLGLDSLFTSLPDSFPGWWMKGFSPFEKETMDSRAEGCFLSK